MNLRCLSKLCCPICKGDISLVSFKEETAEWSDAKIIKEGILLCANCKVWYPIASYVPVMLVFSTPFHEQFASRHELGKAAEYRAPYCKPKPGERSVQKTFSEEWDRVTDGELSFTYTREDLKLLHKFVWLKWPPSGCANVEVILDVGCGLGAEAEALHEISGGAEVFAVDLNFSLFHRPLHLRKPSVHTIIASLFDLPFRENSFDLVYCQGVLHHTYSPYEGFRRIAAYVKEAGQIFVWVYAMEDHLVKRGFAGLLSRTAYLVESIVRPILSRSPAVLRHAVIYALSIALHPLILMRVRHKSDWKLCNTNHGLRDWLTPQYAHRHSFNEVIEWFESLDFSYDIHSPATYRALFGRRLWGIGIVGRKLGNVSRWTRRDGITGKLQGYQRTRDMCSRSSPGN